MGGACPTPNWNASEAMELAELIDAVNRAASTNRPLRLVAGASRSTQLPPGPDTPLELVRWRGIEDHDPRELVVSVRAGTPLEELERILAEAGQCLGAEPARPATSSTIGGALASHDNGPAAPWRGTLRDAVLGMTLINGRAETLHLGGRVLKNVAGYDLSRLQCGAWGALGVITVVHLRTEPLAEKTLSRCFQLPLEHALERMTAWQRRPLPISGLCWLDGRLWLRLSGLAAGVDAAARELGGDDPGDDTPWTALRDRRLPFFHEDSAPLWRLSLPPATPPLPLPGCWLIDWGGAVRWYRGPADEAELRRRVSQAGGWLRPWGIRHNPYHDLPGPQLAVLRRLKRAFDPYGLFNPHLLDGD